MRPAATLVVRNVAWLAVGEVVLKGALFIAGVLVARGLGPAAMGDFTVGYGAALVLMLFLNAGQVEVLIRETAKRPSAVRELHHEARRWQAAVALAAVPLAAGAALLVRQPSLRWTLLAFIPYAWLRCWLITLGAAFKGLDRMEVEVGGRAAELVVALVLLVPLAWLGAPVWTTGVAFSIGAGAGVAVMALQFRRLPGGERERVARGFLAREGLSFVGLAMAAQVMFRSDTFLLAAFGVARADIGRYGVASAPVWGLFALAQLISLALYPTLARAAASGSLRLSRVFALAAVGAGLGLALAAGLQIVRSPLVRLVFGPDYLPAVPLLGLLSWALPGACTGMLLGGAIAACGRQAWSLTLRVVQVALAVAGNIIAIPRWGAAGAAAVAVAMNSLSLAGAVGVAALAVTRPPRTGRAVFSEPEW